MLAGKELELLHALAQGGLPMTAQNLAETLGVSNRSIKNYVKSIVTQYPGAVTSSRSGYQINLDIAQPLLASRNADDLPQTNSERASLVLHKVLSSDKPLDIFDFCEELFISYSTMKSVVQITRRKLDPFALELSVSQNKLQVVGDERAKRRCISSLLHTEASDSFLDLQGIQRAFPAIDIPYIESIIQATFADAQCFANDYSLINLVLHIAISIDRSSLETTCSETPVASPLDATVSESPEFGVARTLVANLQQHFNITMSESDVTDLALLIASRTTMLDYRTASMDNIERFVGRSCLDLIDEIIEDLHENAGIDLTEQEFYIRFALHIKNLIARARTGMPTSNPLTLKIKSDCPLLYDTAVMETALICKRMNISIPDDEIAYIAFHLGSALETQRRLTNKVKAVLYCPRYYDIDAKILLFLNMHFEDDLIVTNVITEERDLDHLQGMELIISTVPVNTHYTTPIHLISIIPTNADKAGIRSLVESIQKKKRRIALQSHLEGLIEPDLFYIDIDTTNRDDAIKTMADHLLDKGYVTAEYPKQVLEREALSSTAFGPVAIPHALRQTSLRSSISVATSPSGVTWGNTRVHLIVMLSFSKRDQRVFYDLFDPLVQILSNRQSAIKLASCASYSEFISTLCDLLE